MTRAGDWAMPATVRGQLSGCGAAYQSGGHPRVEADLAADAPPAAIRTSSRSFDPAAVPVAADSPESREASSPTKGTGSSACS